MTLPANLLPHNPLNAKGVLDELKKLKGEKSWVQFELELLCAQYPKNTVFAKALASISTKAAPAEAKKAAKVVKKEAKTTNATKPADTKSSTL